MRIPFVFVLVLSLSGCSTLLGDVGLVVQNIWQNRAEPPLPTFDSGLLPRYRYMLVHPVGGTPAIYILGAERNTPQGLWESWYSQDGAFIETFNGQLTNLRAYGVRWFSGQWQASNGKLIRSRDVLGLQLFSVADVVSTSPAHVSGLPAPMLVTLNQRVPAHSTWQWFTQVYQTTPSQAALPSAWLAMGTHRGIHWVVASYQCASPALCLRMLRWPVTEVSAE